MKTIRHHSPFAPKGTYTRIVASLVPSRAVAVPLLAVVTFFGCSGPQKALNLSAGSIVLSRPVPAASSLSSAPLGFLPLSNTTEVSKPVLVVDRSAQTMTLTRGTLNHTVPVSFSNFSLQGTVTIAHKQKNPVWYGSEEYFRSRKLSLPAEGHADRYLRGALGEKALFIDQKNAIFSSPLAGTDGASPVSGIVVSSGDLELLFDGIPVGTELVLK